MKNINDIGRNERIYRFKFLAFNQVIKAAKEFFT